MKLKFALALPVLVIALAFAPTAKKTSIKFDLESGKSYAFTTELSSLVKQNMMGQEMVVNQNALTITRMEVKEEGEDKNTYTVWYDKLSGEFSQMGMSQKFDSDTANLEQVDPASKMLAILVDKKFTSVIAHSGEIKEVSGMEKMVEDAVAANPSAAGVSQQLSSLIGVESFKSNMHIFTSVFPSSPVKTGDTWKKEVKLDTGMPLIYDLTMTLESMEGDVANIKVTALIIIDPAGASTEINGMKANIFLDGTRTGNISLDSKTGWIVNATYNDKITGSITLSPSEQLPEGMTIPLEIDNTITAENTK